MNNNLQLNERNVSANIGNRDYTLDIGYFAVGIIDTFGKNKHPFDPKYTRFVFEFVPSVDTRIGPHFDVYIYIGREEDEECEFFGKATALTDIFGSQMRERRGYVCTLLRAGRQLDYDLEHKHYHVVLSDSITQTDSRALEKFLRETKL